jgi:2'-5' RNA ligase
VWRPRLAVELSNFINAQYRPHISLAVYPELEQEYSEKVLQILAARFAQFRLNFSHIGIFNAELKALYFGPTFSAELRDIHHVLHTLYRERPEKCWHYYLPDNWVPHCGVMIDNPSCHLLNPWAVSCKLGVKQPFHPSEEEAHGRQNYNDVLPM